MEKSMKRKYEKPTADKLCFDYKENVIAASGSESDEGNGDVGQGRGRGGGCDGVPYHRNAKTFSSGRNSGC